MQYINSSHNGYISVLVQFGLFLAIPVYFALVGMIYRVRNLVLQAVLIFPVLHNISESSFLRDQHAVWFSFVWACGVGLIITNHTRQISIMQGLREYRLSQQVQLRHQQVALARARARVAPYLPLDEPRTSPVTIPDAPAFPNAPNVIVAHWARFRQRWQNRPATPEYNDNIVAFQDALARKQGLASDPPSKVVKTVWSGVELTLVTDNITEPLGRDQEQILTNVPSHDEQHRLSRIANGVVAGQWRGQSILFATEGVTHPVDSSELPRPDHH